LVVNHLGALGHEENLGVACIYINHRETNLQTPQNILGGLLRQFLLKKPLPDDIHVVYEHHLQRKTKPTLDELLVMFHSAVGQYSRAYCIVDAVDEYPEDLRYILLPYLNKLRLRVNVLITSRPNISIKPFFPSFQDLEISATEQDISHFVTQQILSSSLSRRIEGRPELHAQIQEKLSRSAEGM
jgi:hypothetical protein